MRRIIATALFMGAGAAVVVVSPPAFAAIAPVPPGCGFTLGPAVAGEAAGSAGVDVSLVPLSPVEDCSTTVTATFSYAPAAGGRYNNVSSDPLTQSIPVTFAPSLPEPHLGATLSPFCGDPASPGVITVTVGTASASATLPAQSCSVFGPGISSQLFIAYTTPPAVVGITATPSGAGYDIVGTGGFLFVAGDGAPAPGATTPADGASTAIAAAPVGQGYWVAGSDGSVYSYGSAPFYGSVAGASLNQRIVGMAAAPGGAGYWLVAADGGVFAFGSAGFYGSTGGLQLNAPIVGMAAASDGHGYWLVAEDGGVFAFGSAAFDGSAGSLPLNSPVVGMAADPSGGYWLAAADGGVFAYGGAGFLGSLGGLPHNAPVTSIAATPDGGGYWLLDEDGGVFAFADARFFGSIRG